MMRLNLKINLEQWNIVVGAKKQYHIQKATFKVYQKGNGR